MLWGGGRNPAAFFEVIGMKRCKCVCKQCKKTLTNDIAFKTDYGYFCNESEALMFEEDKKNDVIINMIKSITNTKMPKAYIKPMVNDLLQVYLRDTVVEYIRDNYEYISNSIISKEFESEKNMLNYVFSLLKNHVCEYEEVKEDITKKEEYIEDYEFIPTKYKQKQKRRSLAELEAMFNE